MRPPRRLAVLLAGCTAAALVAGCSDDQPQTEPQSVGASASSEPSAVSLVRAAASSTELQGSARYLLSTETTINGADVVLTGEGEYDWRADRGRTTYAIPSGRVEQRLLGPDLYLALPQQAGVFFRLRAADLAKTPVGGTVDPSAQLHALAAVSELERVGPEQVRGEPTTHYRGSYDVAAAMARAQGLQREALRSSLGAAAAVASAPYDVFLDRDGLLRRLTQTVEVPASKATNGQPLTVTTTLELYDFGLAVAVAGPPRDAVRDGAPLLAALRGVLPRPTAPAPTAPAPSAAPSPGGTPAPSAEPSSSAEPSPSGTPSPTTTPAPAG